MGEAAAAAVDSYTPQVMQRHYDTAFLDYVRYVVGAMWGEVTPDTCASFAAQELINHGMHKRCDLIAQDIPQPSVPVDVASLALT